MPTPFPVGPPFPDGSYGNYNSETQGRGLGPVNVSGIAEWSAGKSPYYVRGEGVSYKGLIYYLNYNWDGTTVGSPGSQVDANGVRVWTLSCDNYTERLQQSEMGTRTKTTNADASFYYHFAPETSIIEYWNYWHNISSAHSVVFEIIPYKTDAESGNGRRLLDLAATAEISPINTGYGDDVKNFQSINFDDANGIDNKMFGFLTSSCGHSNASGPWGSPWGIFIYYGGFKKKLDLSDVGTLYYEVAVTYTLTTADWILSPEFNVTAYGSPVTINWTYTAPSGTTYSENYTVSNLKMTFANETFLGRTYTGAYRIYIKDNLPSDGRWELDSVSPDMRTM